MPNALIDAVMITRDEAAHIEECIHSIQRHCGAALGSVCVYDTGSKDGTPVLAERAGAFVVRGQWSDSFAEARNRALAMARTPWALVIDADERVSGDTHQLLRLLTTTLPEESRPALDIQIIVDCVAGTTSNAWATRILDPQRIHYVNRIHERPVLRSGGPPPTERVPPAAMMMTHRGYTAVARPRKSRRNLRLAQLQVLDRVDTDGAYWAEACFELGRALSGCDDVDAAIPWWERARQCEPISPWGAEAARRLCEAHLEAGRLTTCLKVLHESHDVLGASETHWILGRCALATGRNGEAYLHLQQVAELSDAFGTSFPDTPLRAAGAMAAWRTGRTDEALALMIDLVATGEDVAGLWPSLLAAWGERPTQQLVRLISHHVPRAPTASPAPAPFVASATPAPCASGWGETRSLSSFPAHGARIERPDDDDVGRPGADR